jgi:hypothetical protein
LSRETEEIDWRRPDFMAPQHKRAKSRRGLWMTARQRSGKLRDPWTVEESALVEELARREAEDVRYHKDVRRYGATSAVTIRNRNMIEQIKLILEQRDGHGVPF